MAGRGIGVVYGGGHAGLMGAVADAAMEAGGAVVGVIPTFMTRKEPAHGCFTELAMVKDLHDRKVVMHARSQAVIALPGGFDTMDERFELLTWRRLCLHASVASTGTVQRTTANGAASRSPVPVRMCTK